MYPLTYPTTRSCCPTKNTSHNIGKQNLQSKYFQIITALVNYLREPLRKKITFLLLFKTLNFGKSWHILMISRDDRTEKKDNTIVKISS